MALAAQGGTVWRKMIYTYISILSETQQDRGRNKEHLGSDLNF